MTLRTAMTTASRWAFGLRQRTSTKHVLWATAAMALACMAWVAYRAPVTIAAAQLRSEHASVIVTNENAARFVLPHAFVNGTETCVSNVLISPPRGTRVEYLRHGRSALKIVMPVGTTWDHGQGMEPLPEESRVLEIKDKDCKCNQTDRVRLPIAGIAEFGEVQRDLSGRLTDGERADALLLSGRIVVYARAIPDLFWMPLTVGPFEANALYVVRDIEIPGGTILATGRHDPQSANSRRDSDPRWSGFVDIEFGENDPTAMTVAASVNANDVTIKLPGARVTADGRKYSDADVIPLTLLARLTGDPNLLVIYVMLGAVVAVYKLLDEVSRWSGRKGPANV
jgi:hypothetical protein